MSVLGIVLLLAFVKDTAILFLGLALMASGVVVTAIGGMRGRKIRKSLLSTTVPVKSKFEPKISKRQSRKVIDTFDVSIKPVKQGRESFAKCLSCGQKNRMGAIFCIKCGDKLASYCPKCKRGVPEDANFCDHCGYKIG